MKTTMLQYSKIILSKVSFDRKLFRKEYRKFITLLTEPDRQQLKSWLKGERQLFGEVVLIKN